MMKPIPHNSLVWRAGRYLLSHFAAMVLTLFLVLVLTRYMVSDKGALICGVIAMLVYSLFLYGTMWSFGQKDDNQANFGRIRRRGTKGLVIGAAAALPLLFFSLLLLLSRAGLFFDFIAPYRLLYPNFWPFLNYMQRSGHIMDFTWAQTLICAFVPPLIPIPVAGLGYWMGMRNIAPEQQLIYKSQKKKTE